MNLWTLQYFIKAVEYGHFSKAAESMFVSQSTLSKSIAGLEKELGVPLFERDGKGVSPTSYGRAYYTFAVRAIEELRKGQEAVQSMYHLNDGHLRIGAMSMLCTQFLPEFLWGFQDENPEVTLSVNYSLSSKILQDLRDRAIHLGVCGEFMQDDPEYAAFSRMLLCQDELVLAVSLRHPFALRSSVAVAELKDEKFIAFNWNNLGIDLALNIACGKEGFIPHIKANAYNETNVLGKVAANEGVAVISRHSHIVNSHVRKLHFSGQPLLQNIYLVWIEDDISQSQVAQKFKNYMEDHRGPSARLI